MTFSVTRVPSQVTRSGNLVTRLATLDLISYATLARHATMPATHATPALPSPQLEQKNSCESNTSIFILEDDKLLFRTYPPPTAQTDYRRCLFFGMHTLLGHTFGFIEAIFYICPQTQILGVSEGYP